MTRCAQVAIIGKPNVGKSTLLNAILGQHLSIVTPKPQTTRRNVLGIYSNNDTQLVFVDTPGILKPRYRLQKTMMQYVQEGLEACDVLCVIVDVVKAVEHEAVLDPMLESVLRPIAKKSELPIVLVLNKMDALGQSKFALPLVEQARASGIFVKSVAVSALQNREVESLLEILSDLAPESPFLYDQEQLSTLPQRFFVSELIREVIFHQYKEEIPYATEVSITEFEESPSGPWRISADITVERDSQKIIMIGTGGEAIKRVGIRARKAIQEHLDHPVHLELFVKVRSDWRNDRSQLANLGY